MDHSITSLKRKSVGFDRANTTTKHAGNSPSSSPRNKENTNSGGITMSQLRYLDDFLLKQKIVEELPKHAKMDRFGTPSSPNKGSALLPSDSPEARVVEAMATSSSSTRGLLQNTQSHDLASFYLGSGGANPTPAQLAKMTAMGREKQLSPKRIIAASNRLSDLTKKNERLVALEEKVLREREAECTHKPKLSAFVTRQRVQEAKVSASTKRRNEGRANRDNGVIRGDYDLEPNSGTGQGSSDTFDESYGAAPTNKPPPESLYYVDVPHYMMPHLSTKLAPPEPIAQPQITELARAKERSIGDLFAWEEDRVDRYRLADGNGRPLLGVQGHRQQENNNNTDTLSARTAGEAMDTSLPRTRHRSQDRRLTPPSMRQSHSQAELSSLQKNDGLGTSPPVSRGTFKTLESGKRRAVTPTIRSKPPLANDSVRRSPTAASTAGQFPEQDRVGSGFQINTPRRSRPVFHEDQKGENYNRSTPPGSRKLTPTPAAVIILDEVRRPASAALRRHAKEAFNAASHHDPVLPRSSFKPRNISLKSQILANHDNGRPDVYDDALNVGKVRSQEVLAERLRKEEVRAQDVKVQDQKRLAELEAEAAEADSSEEEVVWMGDRYISRKKDNRPQRKPVQIRQKKHPDSKCGIETSWWNALVQSDNSYRKNRGRVNNVSML